MSGILAQNSPILPSDSSHARHSESASHRIVKGCKSEQEHPGREGTSLSPSYRATVKILLNLRVSHLRTSKSPEPENSVRPSGVNARQYT